MGDQSQLGGFHQIPVLFTENSKVKHYFYVKEHVVRESNADKPAGKTLFVINVPSYCTTSNMREIFEPCGGVSKVYFHDKPTSGLPQDVNKFCKPKDEVLYGFKVAYVVFKKVIGLKKALKHKSILKATTRVNGGVTRWAQEYNSSIVDVNELQKEVDDYMTNYDKKVELEIEKAKEMDGVPDEEGWITVTKHGKKQVSSRTEANKRKVEEKEKKKRSKKELLNFYTFQIRESKMEHIAQLRQKFEEDKKRIALLKSARKFKPY